MESDGSSLVASTAGGNLRERSKHDQMLSLVLMFRSLGGAVRGVLRDPSTRALPLVAIALILSGTIFYWRFEDWSIVESLYFSVVTLTTVGYGDLHPTTDATRLFTIAYIFVGIGVFVALLASVAEQYVKQKAEAPSTRERLKKVRHSS